MTLPGRPPRDSWAVNFEPKDPHAGLVRGGRVRSFTVEVEFSSRPNRDELSAWADGWLADLGLAATHTVQSIVSLACPQAPPGGPAEFVRERWDDHPEAMEKLR